MRRMDEENGGKDLSDGDVTRIAMRIAMSALSQLQTESEASDDAKVLQKYLQLCPYVAPDSPALVAALRALDANEFRTTNGNANAKGSSASVKIASFNRALQPRGNERSAMINQTVIRPAKVQPPSKKKKETKKSAFRSILGHMLRTLCVDFLLASVFFVYLAILWTRHVQLNYIEPQVKSLLWTEERAFRETTYYNRVCDASDMSASKPADLFLPLDATTDEAYEHQLKHGMTVFRGVLSDNSATELRDFISSRNYNLTAEESIFVIENTNRYSFGLGTEEPTVARAVKEIATHPRLGPAIERILGPDPALIEMTAITSSYGAVDQYWHDDVIAAGSAIKFARTFGPSYSFFMQLQNTTTSMGATGVCPGTHMCPDGNMHKFCEKHGFQLVNADGYWRAGDVMLMNMNTWHRGAAHTDPDALDRVMLILTFVPKPRRRTETRQMSQGITFSLRWDMWGHTLLDLANSHNVMVQPFATLRALGLHIMRGYTWGLDYISSSSMRISNEDNGFRRDELEEFVDRGGIKWLPSFLHPELEDDDTYYEYYVKALQNMKAFAQEWNTRILLGYAVIQVVLFLGGWALRLMSSKTEADKPKPFRTLRNACFRLALTHGIIYILYRSALSHVDSTYWAKDLRAGRLYAPAFSAKEENDYGGPSTVPNRNDVLIETRYGSHYLKIYNDFVSNHPGNRKWLEWVKQGSELYPSYGGLPPVFRRAIYEQIVSATEANSGRMLYQGPYSHWLSMSKEATVERTSIEVVSRSNDVLYEILIQLRYLYSECKYGPLRKAVMTEVDIMPFLEDWKRKLLKLQGLDINGPKQGKYWPLDKEAKKSNALRLAPLAKPSCNSKFVRSPPVVLPGVIPGEPRRGAWISQGDIVEARFREDNGREYWYMAEILLASSSGDYTIQFYDGGRDVMYPGSIRWYRPILVGDMVEYLFEGQYVRTEILQDNGDNTYDVFLKKSGFKIRGAHKGDFRRSF